MEENLKVPEDDGDDDADTEADGCLPIIEWFFFLPYLSCHFFSLIFIELIHMETLRYS